MNLNSAQLDLSIEGTILGHDFHRIGSYIRLGKEINIDDVTNAYLEAFHRDPANKVKPSLNPVTGQAEINSNTVTEPKILILSDIPANQIADQFTTEILAPRSDDVFEHILILIRDTENCLWMGRAVHHLVSDGVTIRAHLLRTLSLLKSQEFAPPIQEQKTIPNAPSNPPLNRQYWTKILRNFSKLAPGSGRLNNTDQPTIHQRVISGERLTAVRAWCKKRRLLPADLFQILFGLALDRFQFLHENGALPGLIIRNNRPKDTPWIGGFQVDWLPAPFCSPSWRRPLRSIESLVNGRRRWRKHHRRNASHHPPSGVERQEILDNLFGTGNRISWIIFNWFGPAEIENLDGEISPLRLLIRSRPQDVYLYAYDRPKLGELTLELRTGWDLNPEAVLQAVDTMVSDLVKRGASLIGDLNPLRNAHLSKLPATTRRLPGTTPLALDLIVANARSNPDHLAICTPTTKLTSAGLINQVQRFATGLTAAGLKQGSRVAIHLSTDESLVIAQYGCWWAGMSFLALDPSHPAVRISTLLDHHPTDALVTASSASNVCASGQTLDQVINPDITVLDIDTLLKSSATQGIANLPPESEAYVIHTSGSSGTPKGVSISHHSLSRLLASLDPIISSTPQDRWIVCHSPAFDFSIWEIHGALTSGAQLHMVPPCDWRDPQKLASHIADYSITILNQTPSAFPLVRDALLLKPQQESCKLRWILFGGESLNQSILEPWWNAFNGHLCRLANLYGITETTIHTTWNELTKNNPTPPSSGGWIGLPLDDLTIGLSDDLGRPVPVGISGEIRIHGDGLAREYLNSPELTAERFAAWEHGPSDGRYYRSGDLARLDPVHGLEYLGRIDRQIQLRGHRVEPAEIETLLRQHPGINEVAVVTHLNTADEISLIGYYTPTGLPIDINELDQLLAQQLPSYLANLPLIEVQTFPLTHNGKLDTNRLPVPATPAETTETTENAEKNPRAAKIAAMMAEVLSLPKLSIDSHFFKYGGHSLRAARLCVLLNQTWHTHIPVGTVMTHPTPRKLAAWIDQHSDTVGLQPVTAGLSQNKPILTPSQHRVIALLEENPHNRAYQFQAKIDIKGKLDVAALEAALSELVTRHAGLRLCFSRKEGQWNPRILEPWSISLPMQKITRDEIEPTLNELWEEELDLNGSQLIRWQLFAVAEYHYILAHREHHLIHDGKSFQILLQELAEIYSSPNTNHTSIPSSFDWAVAQNNWLNSDDADRQREFWRNQLSAAPTSSTLPPDWLRPSRQTYSGGLIKRNLDREKFARQAARAAEDGRTIHGDGMCAFALALMEQCGQHDLVIGSGVANRQWPGSDCVVGMLLNNLAMRLKFDPAMTLRQAAQLVFDSIQVSLDNQELPFEEQVQLSGVKREPGVHRLCQVFYTSYFGDIKVSKLGDAILEAHPGESNGSSKFDLNLIVANLPRVEGETPVLLAEYNSSLYREETISNLLDRWLHILDAIHSIPDSPCVNIPLPKALIAKTLPQAVRQPADPDTLALALKSALQPSDPRPCIASSTGELSAAEVERITSAAASHLRSLGINDKQRVALIVQRGKHQILWTISILRLGACAVMIDPSESAENKAKLLTRSDSKLAITADHTLEHSPMIEAGLIDDLPNESAALRWAQPGNEAPAFLFFTSGTTGNPKGVVVPRRAPAQLAQSLDALIPDHERELRVLQLAPPAFDASTFETFFPLLRGGCIVVLEEDTLDASTLAKSFQRHRISTLWLTSSLFNSYVAEKPEFAAELESLIIGGERLSVNSVATVMKSSPGTRLFNGYGPTENCTFTTLHQICPDDVKRANGIPLGHPLPGRAVTIESTNGEIVHPGVTGELVCRGLGLSTGYIDGSSGGFKTDSLGQATYRTGDLVRMASDGVIEFIGRRDSEIKLRGYRVNPIALENTLEEYPLVKEAVTVVDQSSHSIDAYIIPTSGTDTNNLVEGLIREHCASKLPKALHPRKLMVVDHIPKTTNGKLDVPTLQTIAHTFHKTSIFASSARTLSEKRVCDIFGELLGIAEVPADQSFFDLGGHSLLAMRLRRDLETEFNTNISLGKLLENPTPRKIAHTLSGAQSSEIKYTHALPIKRRGKLPILWWTAGGDGGEGAFLTYAALIPTLPKEQPFWGLKAAGIDNPEQSIHRNIHEMVQAYADEIVEIQPEGPYRIGGECLAGSAAWELALELSRRGKHVEKLILLDSYPPTPRRRRKHFIWRSHCRIRSYLQSKISDDWYNKLSRKLPIPEDVAPPSVQECWIHYQRALLKGSPSRDPQIKDFSVIELRSEAEIEKFPKSGWETFIPGIKTLTMQGDHHSYIRSRLNDNAPIIQSVLNEN